MTTAIFIYCKLCYAKIECEPLETFHKRADHLGFVHLSAAPSRSRDAGWLCGDCFADIITIDAGRHTRG